MAKSTYEILKSTGEKAPFSFDKLRSSLKKSGAGNHVVNSILQTIKDELYSGISTREIYNRAYALLRQEKGVFAPRYKLKKALYELGPTGFPFERFIAQVLNFSGYKTEVGAIIQGSCVKHEVDVLAGKNGNSIVIECKFHSDASLKCNVKVPLYIHSRYRDIKSHWNGTGNASPLTAGWVVTNTQFTSDAIDFGNCSGLYLLSWDYPKGNALKDRIDRLGLYPVTVSSLLTGRDKKFLLERDIVLMRQLLESPYILDHMGASEERKKRITEEAKALCNH